MNCPKCIGKLQSFHMRMYEIPQMTETPYIGRNWGVTSSRTFFDLKKYGALKLDRCFVCKGVWFDKGELGKLSRTKTKRKTIGSSINDYKIYKQLDEKGGVCPRCKVPMRKMKGKQKLHKVTIDVCPKCCGIWLDGGEVNYALKGNARQRFQNFWRYLWSNDFAPE
jgi:Zn-finger nucleic acid-binding protein